MSLSNRCYYSAQAIAGHCPTSFQIRNRSTQTEQNFEKNTLVDKTAGEFFHFLVQPKRFCETVKQTIFYAARFLFIAGIRVRSQRE